jgi:hypothetical protein
MGVATYVYDIMDGKAFYESYGLEAEEATMVP